MTGREHSSKHALLWTVGLLAAVLSLVRLDTQEQRDRNEVVAPQPTAALHASGPTPATDEATAVAPRAAARDGAWTRLSAVQREALAPLERVWPTLNEDVKRRWLVIASSFASKSRDTQDRMHTKMAEWSKLSSPQRAEARLRYLQAAKLDTKSKRERWEAYNKMQMQPGQRPRTQLARQIEVVPPMSVRAGPGATTMLMPELLEGTQTAAIGTN